MINCKVLLPATLLLATVALSACEYQVAMHTDVHADGQLHKTIAYQSRDSALVKQYFIASEDLASWNLSIERASHPDPEVKRYWIRLQKSFASADAANQELDRSNDSLFNIHSHFEKKFRWFYTYWMYEDTYRAINRFDYPTETYFTPEELAFIDRLPAEGSAISKADSLFLDQLSTKILDHYAFQAFDEGVFEAYKEPLSQQEVDQQWLKLITKSKNQLLNRKDVGSEKILDFDDPIAYFLDSLGADLPPAIHAQIQVNLQALNRKVEFMSEAHNGIYVHSISMPGTVVSSNADSLAGNTLVWRPSTLKFMMNDYTFRAESRQMNVEVLVISLLAIGVGVFLSLRKPKA